MLKNLLDWIVADRLTINPKTTLPTTNIEAGRMEFKDGILYTYDSVRGKWLSIQRQTFLFGRAGITNNQYLNMAGNVISTVSGYRMPRNACIVSASAQSATSHNYTIHFRKNDSDTNIYSLPTYGDKGKSVIDINVNISNSEYLQCYLEYLGTGSGVKDPVVMVELAWRGN